MDLKNEFNSLLNSLKNINIISISTAIENISNSLSDTPDSLASDEYYTNIYKLLLNPSLPPAVISTALDSLTRLCSRHYITGNTIQPPQPPQKELWFILHSDAINLTSQPFNLLINDIIRSICSLSNTPDEHSQLSILKLLLTLATSSHVHIHLHSLILILETCFYIHIHSKFPVNSATAKGSLVRIINTILIKFDSSLRQISTLSTEENINSDNPYSSDPITYASICRDDVYLTIRFISAMSLTNDGTFGSIFNDSTIESIEKIEKPSPIAIKTRTLSLELILTIFSNACPPLLSITNSDIVFIIRNYVCNAISRNAMTTFPKLFELSISIFLMVIQFYLPVLKPEVEIILNSVFINILEMENSTFKQKSVILQGLLKISENSQILVDLFINYDCDFAAGSVFERIVNSCARISHGKRQPSEPSSFLSFAGFDSKPDLLKAQEQRLKLRSTGVLVSIVNSLVNWIYELSPDLKPLQMIENCINDNRDSVSSVRKNDGLFIDNHPIVLSKSPLQAINMNLKHHDQIHQSESNLSAQSPEDPALDLEEVANRKQALKQAIRVFNIKPLKGMVLLTELELFDVKDPTSIATFFRASTELSKSSIGEYIGDGNPFNIQVMYSYVDMFDFKSMAFVSALRTFLQSFRLPGEAQKIDRIMEKFADRYVETNPDVFAKADAAYTLAFSVMMLNTDQHSPSIKEKNRMDKAAFIKMNRGINDESDLPEEFLGEIFDEINSNEIVLEGEKSGNQALVNLHNGQLKEHQRMELYDQEIQILEKKSHLLIKGAKDGKRKLAPFRTVRNADVARPMFAMICWPLMAAFGHVFESSTDSEDEDPSKKISKIDLDEAQDSSASLTGRTLANGRSPIPEPAIIDLVLQGFSASILITAMLKLETERDAFISSLTNLTSLSNLSGIKYKNVKAIKTLISLSNSLGDYLDSSWSQILRVISQLERILLLSDRIVSDKSGIKKSIDSKPPQSIDKKSNGLGGIEDQLDSLKSNAALEKLIVEFQTQSNVILIDKIFTASTNLSAQAIIQFIKCVCFISLEEVGLSKAAKGELAFSTLSHPSNPRMYMLQKLVEISSYNLHRIRFEWTQIWRLLQPHFNVVACHSNLTVAKYAVDSLRQLSMKFLEKEELSNFSTQFEFLRSFEWIMKNSSLNEIQDLILNAMSQMVSSRAHNIRSGWKSILIVLSQVTKGTPKNDLVKFSFSIVQMIYDAYFDVIFSSNSFVEYTACLSEFALLESPELEEIISSSILLLKKCAEYIMKQCEGELVKKNDTMQTPSSSRNSILSVKEDKVIVLEDFFYLQWFPIFSAFGKVVIRSKNILVRTRTIESLFEVLQKSGHLFDSCYWKPIHQNVIFPIFEDLRDSNIEKNAREANNVVWISGLRLWVETFTLFFNEIFTGTGMVPLKAILILMVDMMGMKDEKLAPCGQICLVQLIQNNYHKISNDEVWDLLLSHIELAFGTTIPAELVQCSFSTSLDNEGNQVIPESFNYNSGRLSGSEVYDLGKKAAKKVFPELVTLNDLDFEHTIIKCVTHLEMIQSLGNLLVLPLSVEFDRSSLLSSINEEWKRKLLACIYDSYIVARYFNSFYDLRNAIWKKGLVQQMPNLVKQETTSISNYIRILFSIYKVQGDQSGKETCDLIIKETMDVFERFIEFLQDQNKNQRDIGMWSPVVIMIFQELLAMGGWWNVTIEKTSGAISRRPSFLEKHKSLKKQLPIYFKLGIQMMSVDRHDVRMILQEFLERVGEEFVRI